MPDRVATRTIHWSIRSEFDAEIPACRVIGQRFRGSATDGHGGLGGCVSVERDRLLIFRQRHLHVQPAVGLVPCRNSLATGAGKFVAVTKEGDTTAAYRGNNVEGVIIGSQRSRKRTACIQLFNRS